MAYDPHPCYAPIGGEVDVGWSSPARTVSAGTILALDGPAILDWEAAILGLSGALRDRGLNVREVDVRAGYAPWEDIVSRTTSAELADDPDFARIAEGGLAQLFQSIPASTEAPEDVTIVFGPGAALAPHDTLWYLDLPKRYAEAAAGTGDGRQLGARPESRERTTLRRLFYIDWPLLDLHRDAIAGRIDRYVDTQEPTAPRSIAGHVLRRTTASIALQPFRTRPTFNTTPWGGHWAQRELRVALEARNTALGYELIAPEAGVIIGDRSSASVEVPFQLIVAQYPEAILGARVHTMFGTSFPIRFDYLDTLDGGNLSVHCHPQADYMRRVFGWPYTQHETYYMMVGGEGRRVFLGLRGDADTDAFHREAADAEQHGRAFDITRYVRTHPADPHRLFTIPAGTPHGSGEGNVVLEVSATPYLYSLRFYDWLRRNVDGTQRPVHVAHAFANLNRSRTGRQLAGRLLQEPRVIRAGVGWGEELLSRLPEMFFEVRRHSLGSERPVADDSSDGFHVLNVVEGPGVIIETHLGSQALSYAETMIVPAAVGTYSMRRAGSSRVRVVKALVGSSLHSA